MILYCLHARKQMSRSLKTRLIWANKSEYLSDVTWHTTMYACVPNDVCATKSIIFRSSQLIYLFVFVFELQNINNYPHIYWLCSIVTNKYVLYVHSVILPVLTVL